jgi:hypothetical protein
MIETEWQIPVRGQIIILDRAQAVLHKKLMTLSGAALPRDTASL